MPGSQVPQEGGELPGDAVYALGSDPGERVRLQWQSGELRPHAVAILDRVGIGPGQAAIDVGCGPSGILDLLAERTSPGGRVVGLDIDPANVAMASELVRERRLADVEVVQGDAKHTGLPAGSFDLVHAGTLLINIPEPEAAVAEMVRLARPGGWVAGQEPDRIRRRTGRTACAAAALVVLPAGGPGAGYSFGGIEGDAMSDSDSDYAFGSAEDELARLELQGRALAPATRMIFGAAGIRPGMRVLDLGCGAGDVAFVAADLVGPDGHVVGVDRSADALARARLRAQQRGLAQVEFVEGDIHDRRPGGPFDAIVGRLLLMYVPDPAAVLRRQATVLRAGGLVVPIEFDIFTGRSLPALPLVSQALAWLAEAFARGGIQPSLGARLWTLHREAGLHPVGMLGVQPHFGPGDPAAVGLLAGIIRTASPLIERTGVATAEEIGAETFAQRLTDDLQTNQAVFAHPILLSAWATTDEA